MCCAKDAKVICRGIVFFSFHSLFTRVYVCVCLFVGSVLSLSLSLAFSKKKDESGRFVPGNYFTYTYVTQYIYIMYISTHIMSNIYIIHIYSFISRFKFTMTRVSFIFLYTYLSLPFLLFFFFIFSREYNKDLRIM